MRRATASPLIAALIALVLLASCGKKRDIAPEELGTPTTMPRDQVLYREARETFLAWMGNFGGTEDGDALARLMTRASRTRLADAGIRSAADIRQWFDSNRTLGRAPFIYRFSRVDVLDIEMRDTNTALVTAGFLVDLPDRRIETVGTITLVRERGSWHVPFGEDGTWERSWWQQDRSFSARVRDDGITHASSDLLGIDFSYPQSWDMLESKTTRVPGSSTPQHGVALTYVNPGSMEREVIVRLWTGPPAPASTTTTAPPPVPGAKDTTADVLRVISRQDAQFTDGVHTAGTLFTLRDDRSGLTVYMYAGVNDAIATWSTFASNFQKILDSIIPGT